MQIDLQRRAAIAGIVAAFCLVGWRMARRQGWIPGAPSQRQSLLPPAGPVDVATTAPADGGSVIIPALEAPLEESLALIVTTDRIERGRRLHLRLGAGEAAVTLHDPKSKEFPAFAGGVLEPIDRARGAAFVEEVARWLGAPVPAPAPGPQAPLRPIPFRYVHLGSQDGWEANKLFLQTETLESEVYLNIRQDGRAAAFLEKDPGYRRDLLAVLALYLRDGAPKDQASPDGGP